MSRTALEMAKEIIETKHAYGPYDRPLAEEVVRLTERDANLTRLNQLEREESEKYKQIMNRQSEALKEATKLLNQAANSLPDDVELNGVPEWLLKYGGEK